MGQSEKANEKRKGADMLAYLAHRDALRILRGAELLVRKSDHDGAFEGWLLLCKAIRYLRG